MGILYDISCDKKYLISNNIQNKFVNKSKQVNMKIILTKEESEKHFHNALCNGSVFAQYGTLDYSIRDYNAAKKNLKKLKPKESICTEDVWMQILRDGKKLKYIDYEDKAMNKEITIDMVHKRVAKTPLEFLVDAVMEQDDAITASIILQQVIFDEQIFG